MAPGARGEPSGTFHGLGGDAGNAGEFEVERGGFGQPPLVQRG